MNRLNGCILSVCLSVGFFALGLDAQVSQQAATFGQIINLGYTPSDVVLDESRGLLYLVNTNGNKIDVIGAASQKLVRSIPIGKSPVAAAMSADNSTLYVTNSGGSTVSVIDLNASRVTLTVALPAVPQGI